MTELQRQRIKNLDSENMALKKLARRHKIKVCKYCGHDPNQKQESKKEIRKRVDDGLEELKNKGILVYDTTHNVENKPLGEKS